VKHIPNIRSNSTTDGGQNQSPPIQSWFRSQVPLLPPEIVKAWTNNEYRIGDRHSTDYEYIGAALTLRGYYRYGTFREVAGKKDLLHAGYCVVDLDGPDLFIAGIRVYTGPHQNKPHKEQSQWVHPIYWRSLYSKFVPDGKMSKVHFGYCAFKFESTDKTYSAKGLRLGAMSKDVTSRFNAIEDFWAGKRGWLRRVCRAANKNHDMDALDAALRDKGVEIMARIQNRSDFLSEMSLLQLHARSVRLVGIITVDVGRTFADANSQLLASVYQPIDIPASA
jgi:hypothetical protein